MATYTVIGTVTGLEIGQTINDGELNTNHPGLGGAKRLLELGVIREGAGEPPAPGTGPGGDVERVRASEATGNENVKTAGRMRRPA